MKETQASGANVCLLTRLGVSQGDGPGVDPPHDWPLDRIKMTFQGHHRSAADTPIAPILGSNVTWGNHYAVVTRYGVFVPGGVPGTRAKYWANFWAGAYRSSSGIEPWVGIGEPKTPDEIVDRKLQLEVVGWRDGRPAG